MALVPWGVDQNAGMGTDRAAQDEAQAKASRDEKDHVVLPRVDGGRQEARPENDLHPRPQLAPRLIHPVTERWQFGIMVTARAGVFRHMVGTVSVPNDWPEQEVRFAAQDTSKVRRLAYRELAGGSKQMVVEIEPLRPGEQARAIVTLELVRHTVASPDETDALASPQAPPADLRHFLVPSPQIESDRPEIRAAAARFVDRRQSAWEQVESVYRWILDHVEYRAGSPKGALATLRSGRGKWEDRTCLFIALCRANNIPARLVWVPGHCYAEFCLEDDRGQHHWFPCDLGEHPQLGSTAHTEPILQKGDRFQVPGQQAFQRYVFEGLVGCSVVGNGRPEFEVIRRRE